MAPYPEQEEEFRIPGGTNFLVRVLYRQNSSWQGTIQWLDESKTLSFRSMLEMIHLMEEAIHMDAAHERDRQLREWPRAK